MAARAKPKGKPKSKVTAAISKRPSAPLKRPAATTTKRPSAPLKRPAATRTLPAKAKHHSKSKTDGPNALGLPNLKQVPLLWEFKTNAPGAYGIFVDEARCMMGDESGFVADMNHDTGEPRQTYQLPTGVKCIVGDGDYLYVGTNDGKIYDLTQGRPRDVAQIEGFEKLYWIDIHEGQIAASDNTGKVGMLNCEGEVLWTKETDGRDGWLCRMDRTGIYHGTSVGVKKFSLQGELLWACSEKIYVNFGVQTKDHIWAIGWVPKDISPEQSLIVKINKATGVVESKMQGAGPSSCSISPERVYDSGMCVQPANVEFAAWQGAAWKRMKIDPFKDIFSQQMVGDRIYAVGHAVGPSTELRDSAEAVAEQAEEATSAEGKVIISCVQEGSKIRARVASDGYDSSLNVQFPRAFREVGVKFVVDSVELAPNGDFYRCKGEPQRLRL